MCPDWESNWGPFGSQAITQTTEPYQPGLFLYDLLIIVLFPIQTNVNLFCPTLYALRENLTLLNFFLSPHLNLTQGYFYLLILEKDEGGERGEEEREREKH